MSEQLPHICDGAHDPSDEPEGEIKHYRVQTRGHHSTYTFWYCADCAELDRRHGHKVEEIGAEQ